MYKLTLITKQKHLQVPLVSHIFKRLCGTVDVISVGEKASLSKTFTREDVEAFAAITYDNNPIHTDEEVAKQSRFGRCIVHGVLTIGLLSGVMGSRMPGPGSILLSYDITHPFPLYVNEPVTAQVTVEEIQGRLVTLGLLCTAPEDKIVTKGVAKLLVPKHKVRVPPVYKE